MGKKFLLVGFLNIILKGVGKKISQNLQNIPQWNCQNERYGDGGWRKLEEYSEEQ